MSPAGIRSGAKRAFSLLDSDTLYTALRLLFSPHVLVGKVKILLPVVLGHIVFSRTDMIGNST